MENTNHEKSNVTFEIIRIVMSFFVIYTHCIQSMGGVPANPSLGTRVIVDSMIYNFTLIAVPQFLMISGALLLSKEDSRKKQVKRVGHVSIQLCIWSAFTYLVMLYDKGLSILENVQKFKNLVLYSYVIGPLWYLYAYIVLLFLLPLMRKTVKVLNIKDYFYLLFFYLLIFALPNTINVLTGEDYSTFFTTYINNSLYTLLFFAGGYYLSVYKEKLDKSKCMRYVGILSFVFIGCCVFFGNGDSEKLYGILYYLGNYDSVFNPLMSICVFSWFLSMNNTFNSLNNFGKKVIILIGGTTGEIYLMGTIVLTKLCPYVSRLYLENDVKALILAGISWVMSFIIAVGVNFVKKILIYVIKKIKFQEVDIE